MDILTNDEISYSEVWRKNPAPSPGITSATTAWRLHQAPIAIPEDAGRPVRDNRRRESCAEGCWWRGAAE